MLIMVDSRGCGSARLGMKCLVEGRWLGEAILGLPLKEEDSARLTLGGGGWARGVLWKDLEGAGFVGGGMGGYGDGSWNL